ncbi:MAG: FAD-dependent monooxygenase, partial [Bacillota bacterium]
MSMPRLLIAGGGPVGVALACACDGFDATVIEASAAPPAIADALDLRVFALSAGSRDLLKALGAWQRMDAGRIACVRRMEVFGDRGARIEFAPPLGESLAWIVEGSRLAVALEQAVAARPSIRIVRGAAARSFEAGPGGVVVQLADDAKHEAELLVGADGPDSRVRAAAGIPAEEHPYHEVAVVAHFDCERAHEGIARQWFRSDGVLAWLPLPGKRISIVWSAPHAVADELSALSMEAFARRVRESGDSLLGELRPISSIGRFPLRLI